MVDESSGRHQWVASFGDGERAAAPFDAQARTASAQSWLQWSTTRTAPYGDRPQPPGGARGEVRAKATEAPSSPAGNSSSCKRRPAEPRGAQDRVLRHTVEQIIETFVPVPMLDLDAPVPQTVDQLVDILKFFDTFLPGVAEQVIVVPKFVLQAQIPQRTTLLDPLLVEQCRLSVSPSFVRREFVEQNVDIPVPGARGWLDGGGFQCFSQGQSLTAFSGAAEKVGSFVTASQKLVAEKSVAKSRGAFWSSVCGRQRQASSRLHRRRLGGEVFCESPKAR